MNPSDPTTPTRIKYFCNRCGKNHTPTCLGECGANIGNRTCDKPAGHVERGDTVHVDFDIPMNSVAAYAEMLRELASAERQRVAVALSAIEYDRTKVSEAVTAMKDALHQREWLKEGRGSYEWDDDRWHDEFAAAYDEIFEAMKPLEKIAADWTLCSRDSETIVKQRMDLQARADAAEAKVAELERELRDVSKQRDAYMFRCRKCGEPTDIAPDLPELAVCEKCCEDHNFIYIREERLHACEHCGKPKPIDYD